MMTVGQLWLLLYSVEKVFQKYLKFVSYLRVAAVCGYQNHYHKIFVDCIKTGPFSFLLL